MNASTRMKLLGLVAGVAAAVAVASPAQAASDYGDVVATWQGNNATGRPVIAGDGGVFRFLRDNANLADDFPGVLVDNNPVNTFIGICLERGEFVKTSPVVYTARDVADAPVDTPPTTMGVDRARDVAKLVTLAFGGQLVNALTVGQPTVLAFQIALWEISTDRATGAGSYSLAGGDYSASNGQATTWLNLLNSEFNTPTLPQTALAKNLYALTNDDAQDMLVQTPIPAAAWLLGSGLLGLFGIARRRRTVAA